MPADESYEGWAIVELFGHRVIPSYVKPVAMYGGTMAKVDTRDTHDPPIVQYYGASAIYCVTPSTEEEVRRRNRPYDHRRALNAGDADLVEDDREDDDWPDEIDPGDPPDEDDMDDSKDSDAPISPQPAIVLGDDIREHG